VYILESRDRLKTEGCVSNPEISDKGTYSQKSLKESFNMKYNIFFSLSLLFTKYHNLDNKNIFYFYSLDKTKSEVNKKDPHTLLL
jgi:hypothetical protein